MKKLKSVFSSSWKESILLKKQPKISSKFSLKNNKTKPKWNKIEFFKPIKLNQKNKLFKKESLKQRKLSPYGDVDMDGSPNKFDCSPRRVEKDGLLDVFHSLVGKKYTTEERAKMFEKQRLKDEKLKKRVELAKKLAKKIEKTKKVSLKKASTKPAKVASVILPEGTIPKNVVSENKKTGGIRHSRPGRPKGSLSAGYYIPGRGPVDVRVWRKWVAKQRKLKKMLEANKMAFTKEGKEIARQKLQERYVEKPDETEDISIEGRDLEQAQQIQSNAQEYSEEQLTREPGVRLATDKSESILNAPNVMKGELRKVVHGINEKPIIKLPPRPVANRDGYEYVDIEPASGKPIVKRRITEKWMTGEAY